MLFQNEGTRVVGNHVTDMDMHENNCSARNHGCIYEGTLSTDQGRLSVSLLKIGCNISFLSPLGLAAVTVKYVDMLMPFIDPSGAGSTFLKLDGRIDSQKIVYLSFGGGKVFDDVYSYPGLTVSLSLWKIDCFDATAFSFISTDIEKETISAGACGFSGGVSAFSIPCNFATSAVFNWNVHRQILRRFEMGNGRLSTTRAEWVSLDLDPHLVFQFLAEDSGLVCLQLKPNSSVNETVRFQGNLERILKVDSNEEELRPRIDMLSGLPFVYTSSSAMCSITVSKGTGVLDHVCSITSDDSSLNMLMYDVGFDIVSKWSNILSDSGISCDEICFFRCAL